MKRTWSALICATLLAVAARAQAAPQQQFDDCYPYTGGGGGLCMGSFYGFANDTTQPTYAVFGSGSNGMWFAAAYHGSYFSCSVPPSNSGLQDIFRSAIASRGDFLIQWDGAGNCNYAWIKNSTMSSTY